MSKQRAFPGAVIVLLLSWVALPVHAQAQADADKAGIRAAVLDYIEGWYEGDAARMERALHPELAKRMVSVNPKKGRSMLDQQSAMTLVLKTRLGLGKETPVEKQVKDVTIFDIYRGAASAKVVATGWIDYFHLARWNGQWKIVNVLWELEPQKK